jgi:hypothetical protein
VLVIRVSALRRNRRRQSTTQDFALASASAKQYSNDPEVGGLPAWRSTVASRSCCQPVVTAAEQD